MGANRLAIFPRVTGRASNRASPRWWTSSAPEVPPGMKAFSVVAVSA
jgi:hypothetical protein